MIELIDFWAQVQSKSVHPGFQSQRYGQIAYNHLSRVRPDLAEQIAGTARDPFYVENHIADQRFLRFCDFLIDNW